MEEDLLQREEYIVGLYKEAAQRALQYTPQLFIRRVDNSTGIEALGSSVIVRQESNYFLVTAAHCILQNGVFTQIGILDSSGTLQLIRGAVVINRGSNEEIDIAVVKLSDTSIRSLSGKYRFLDSSRLMKNSNIADEVMYLIVGYPLTKTKIDNNRKRLRYEPLVYMPYSKETAAYDRLGYEREKNTLLKFSQRRGKFAGERELVMNPDPKGISGCGLWYIHRYDVEKIEDVEFSLSGIMIEHHKARSMMVATKMEHIVPLIIEAQRLDANRSLH